MKKKILTLILAAAVSAAVLAGCGSSAEPANSGSVVNDESATADVADNTEAEAELEPEPECTHEWVEATFAKPKTCSLCGETDGEPRQSYFDEHGENVPDAPVACTVDALIYNPDNPEEYQMATDGVWEQIDCYSEPTDEDGYQLIYFKLCVSIQNYYDAAQNMSYNNSFHRTLIYDWYTGRMLPVRSMSGTADAFDFSTTLDIDGISYDVAYTKEVQWEFETWVYDDNGNARSNGRGYVTYIFKVPDGYDGLVFAAIPKNEYTADIEDTETVSGTDEDDAYYALDEGHYVDGTQFFRINRQEDSPITSGENAISGAASNDTSDGAVIDDGREQGSIGESGLPYYKIGFSPKDFTISGLSIYDVKNAEEMYEAIDLPDWDEFKGDGWDKQLNTDMGKVFFEHHVSSNNMGYVQYTDNTEKSSIFFSSIDEYTIADVDFVQSPIVPGETSWDKAVDVLGIRDLLEAMGIQDTPFENIDKFAFESQYSENSYCYTKWSNDSNQSRIHIGWTDEDGKEVCLTLWFADGNDVVSSMEISKTH